MPNYQPPPPPYSAMNRQPTSPRNDPYHRAEPMPPRTENEPLLPRSRSTVSRARTGLIIVGLLVLPLIILLPLNAFTIAQVTASRSALITARKQLGVLRTQLASLRSQREQETLEWADERQRRDAERWRQDAEKRDADERTRMRLFWEAPHRAEHCARYGARDYTSRLWNVADGYDWVQACQRTPIAIHNNIIAKPDWCEIRDGVWGHWTVPFMEPDCEAHWDQILDMGCIGTGSGLRQFKARLDGVHWGENAQHLCETAPASIRGVHYDQPKHCSEHDREMWAAWEVRDNTYC